MITEKDLHEAIAECQGIRNPNASTCIKLAAYYIILDHMGIDRETGYSYSDSPDGTDLINYESESDFSRVVNGRKVSEVIPVIDELMEAIKVLNPPLYNGVMRRF